MKIFLGGFALIFLAEYASILFTRILFSLFFLGVLVARSILQSMEKFVDFQFSPIAIRSTFYIPQGNFQHPKNVSPSLPSNDAGRRHANFNHSLDIEILWWRSDVQYLHTRRIDRTLREKLVGCIIAHPG